MWWARQKIHSSWILALVSTFFVSGVVAALFVRVYWWLGIVMLLPLSAVFIFRFAYLLPVAVVWSVVLGLSLGSAHLGARDSYDDFIGKTVRLEGKVREDPSKASSGATSLQLEAVVMNDIAMPGAVYVNIRGSPDVKRGDVVTVMGEAKSGFGNFPISISALKLDSIRRPVPGDLGRVVRDWFAEKVRILVSEPQA